MTEKHRSVNNVLWRVAEGRIRRGRGPDAARRPPVGHPGLRGFRSVGVRKWGSPIDLGSRPYNRSALPCCLWFVQTNKKRKLTTNMHNIHHSTKYLPEEETTAINWWRRRQHNMMYLAFSHGTDVAPVYSWLRARASSARIWRTNWVKSAGNCGLTSVCDISHIPLTVCSMSRIDANIWSALSVWLNSKLLRTFCEPKAYKTVTYYYSSCVQRNTTLVPLDKMLVLSANPSVIYAIYGQSKYRSKYLDICQMTSR